MANAVKIKVGVTVRKEERNWIIFCPALKTYGYSTQSETAAFADFDNAVKVFFHVQNTLGTLNQALSSLGWTRTKKEVSAPKYFNTKKPIDGGTKKERQISVPSC